MTRRGVHPDTPAADLIFAAGPYRIMADLQTPVYAEMARRDADFYARLEKVGFLHAVADSVAAPC